MRWETTQHSLLKAELLVSCYCPQLFSLSRWNLFLSIPFSLNLSLWYSEKRANYSKCLCWSIVSPLVHSPLGSSYVKWLNPTALTTHRANKETQFSQCSLFLCFWVSSRYVGPDLGPFPPSLNILGLHVAGGNADPYFGPFYLSDDGNSERWR